MEFRWFISKIKTIEKAIEDAFSIVSNVADKVNQIHDRVTELEKIVKPATQSDTKAVKDNPSADTRAPNSMRGIKE